MRWDDPREIFVWTALQYHGHFYSWGGDDPSAFDCSGLAVECGKSSGALPRKRDFTANDLWHRWPRVPVPAFGRLVFYGGSGTGIATHVEICLSPEFSIGASGGGSKTKTREDAIRDNAFIKIRPIERGRLILGFCDPFAVPTI